MRGPAWTRLPSCAAPPSFSHVGWLGLLVMALAACAPSAASGAVDLIGNAVFALGAVLLLAAAGHTVRATGR